MKKKSYLDRSFDFVGGVLLVFYTGFSIWSRLKNPDATETRLFIMYWKVWVLPIAFYLVAFAISKAAQKQAG